MLPLITSAQPPCIDTNIRFSPFKLRGNPPILAFQIFILTDFLRDFPSLFLAVVVLWHVDGDRGSGHTKTRPQQMRRAGFWQELLLAFFFEAIFLVEAVDTAVGCSELLATRVEWVALGADFNFDVFFHGTCFEGVAARASHFRCFVFRMNGCFHEILLLSP